MNTDREAEQLATLICSEPPMTREQVAHLIAAALAVAETEGSIRGMQHVNSAITEAFRPAKVA